MVQTRSFTSNFTLIIKVLRTPKLILFYSLISNQVAHGVLEHSHHILPGKSCRQLAHPSCTSSQSSWSWTKSNLINSISKILSIIIIINLLHDDVLLKIDLSLSLVWEWEIKFGYHEIKSHLSVTFSSGCSFPGCLYTKNTYLCNPVPFGAPEPTYSTSVSPLSTSHEGILTTNQWRISLMEG